MAVDEALVEDGRPHVAEVDRVVPPVEARDALGDPSRRPVPEAPERRTGRRLQRLGDLAVHAAAAPQRRRRLDGVDRQGVEVLGVQEAQDPGGLGLGIGAQVLQPHAQRPVAEQSGAVVAGALVRPRPVLDTAHGIGGVAGPPERRLAVVRHLVLVLGERDVPPVADDVHEAHVGKALGQERQQDVAVGMLPAPQRRVVGTLREVQVERPLEVLAHRLRRPRAQVVQSPAPVEVGHVQRVLGAIQPRAHEPAGALDDPRDDARARAAGPSDHERSVGHRCARIMWPAWIRSPRGSSRRCRPGSVPSRRAPHGRPSRSWSPRSTAARCSSACWPGSERRPTTTSSTSSSWTTAPPTGRWTGFRPPRCRSRSVWWRWSATSPSRRPATPARPRPTASSCCSSTTTWSRSSPGGSSAW